jgi:hypothetical protein
MVVDERSRRELYRRLEEVLGAEAATTLIEHLPPVGWADIATRHDLAALEQRIDLRFARVDDRFQAMEQRFDERFDHIERQSGLRFDNVGDRFNGIDHHITGATADLRATFEHELRAQMTTVVFGLVSVVLTMAALAFALVRFT